MNTSKIINDFPILRRKINGKKIIYLDSAATSQKPKQVIRAMDEFYENYNANVHRGVYRLSEEATERYEQTREKIAKFISAGKENQVIYTRSTTEAINIIMRGYGEKYIKKGDRVVTTVMEHHSNFVPWQQLAHKKNAKFIVLDIDEKGAIQESGLEKIKKARVIAITHVSNVLGTINKIKEICKIAREHDCISIVDGAQSTPHMSVNVKEIGCDFFAFSGHKMLGPTGIGILYGREELLEVMDPLLFGGEMISEVSIEKTEWNRLPYKFEAGTLPIAEVIGLGAAIDYLDNIGMNNIMEHEKELAAYAMKRITEIENLKVFGPRKAEKRGGLISFVLDEIHAHDVATVLDELGIAIRSGHHCAMPLHNRLGVPATARASFYIYNTKKDVDALIDGLQYAKKIFKT